MKLQEQAGKIQQKIDAFSLRERVLIFAAAAFLLVSLIDALVLEPLLNKQKAISAQVIQQQEKMKEVQAQLSALIQAKQADANSPQREHIRQLREQIAAGDAYLKDKRDKLVPPEKMAGLLEQVLNKNAKLQLVALETLPVSPFVESTNDAASVQPLAQETQMYKHGVQITVRGNYADLMQYLNALEHLPTRMFWGTAKLKVVQYPTSELMLTLYTLSLDKTWLQV
jgi:MSHA biogenesis protein MshJ